MINVITFVLGLLSGYEFLEYDLPLCYECGILAHLDVPTNFLVLIGCDLGPVRLGQTLVLSSLVVIGCGGRGISSAWLLLAFHGISLSDRVLNINEFILNNQSYIDFNHPIVII
jgi:hypothetical protein